jgi:hypothetical protein
MRVLAVVVMAAIMAGDAPLDQFRLIFLPACYAFASYHE